MKNNTLVVNFFGGPGISKTTMMANCFANLKWDFIDCEISTEYAKDKVWEGSSHVLENQFYISAKQHHRLYNLNGKVKVILTDSPLLLGIYYGKNEPKEFKDMLLTYFNQFNNLNVLLTREKKYNPNGRLQTEEQSRQIDNEIIKILKTNSISYVTFPGKQESVIDIVKLIESKIM
jgi:hypothetical protein